MNCKKTILFILLINSVISFGGSIVLYKNTKTGIPPKTSTQIWELKSNNKIWVYYKHDYKYSSNAQFKINISKKIDKKYQKIESVFFQVQKGQTSSKIQLDIKEAGEYILSVIDDKGYIAGEHNYTVI